MTISTTPIHQNRSISLFRIFRGIQTRANHHLYVKILTVASKIPPSVCIAYVCLRIYLNLYLHFLENLVCWGCRSPELYNPHWKVKLWKHDSVTSLKTGPEPIFKKQNKKKMSFFKLFWKKGSIFKLSLNKYPSWGLGPGPWPGPPGPWPGVFFQTQFENEHFFFQNSLKKDPVFFSATLCPLSYGS